MTILQSDPITAARTLSFAQLIQEELSYLRARLEDLQEAQEQFKIHDPQRVGLPGQELATSLAVLSCQRLQHDLESFLDF